MSIHTKIENMGAVVPDDHAAIAAGVALPANTIGVVITVTAGTMNLTMKASGTAVAYELAAGTHQIPGEFSLLTAGTGTFTGGVAQLKIV